MNITCDDPRPNAMTAAETPRLDHQPNIRAGQVPRQHRQATEQAAYEQIDDRDDHSAMIPAGKSVQARSSNRAHRRAHLPAGLSRKRIQRRAVLGGLISEYERAARKTRSVPMAEFWNPTGTLPHLPSQGFPGVAATAPPTPTSDAAPSCYELSSSAPLGRGHALPAVCCKLPGEPV